MTSANFTETIPHLEAKINLCQPKNDPKDVITLFPMSKVI